MKAFEPFRMGKLELKNRLVVSAMVTNYCNPDGTPTEKYLAYHEHKAQGGWGLIITEDYAIAPKAGGFIRLPGLWEDSQIQPHQELTRRVHQAGGKIVVQIYHAGRETSSAITGERPVGPSPIREPSMPETPRELTVEEIHQLVEQFGDCARRAQQAGFDGVEVHGAHGYLVGAFASPFANKRCDEYGGTIQNRARFAVEIIRNIKQKCGADFPVLYRMSAVEYVPGGLEIEEAKVLARLVEKAGADCIHCSQGVYASTQHIIPPSVVARGAYVQNAAAIKSAVHIPVIAVGRINDIQVAESILQFGQADLVTMARASLADPEMPKKIQEGREDEVLRCIGCLQGCAGENGKGHCVRCLVNPLTGMEDVYDFSPAKECKRVLVIGGGVSGCEAAIAAAQRGHRVTLLEKSGQLGGQWIPASMPVGKSEFTSLLLWQKAMLEKLHIQVLLNTQADGELIRLYEPDAVVVATGSKPFVPGFLKGADQDFVVNAHDVLLGKVEVQGKVVVVGGGLVGAETADTLSQSCQVSVIEMQPRIMGDGEYSTAYYMKQRFQQFGVQVYTSTKVLEIGSHTVAAEREGQAITLEDVDFVVIAVGVKTDTALFDQLERLPWPVYKVGDANGVKNGYLGIREGFEAGLAL